MYLLAKFGSHRSYRIGVTNPYINSYPDILENAELTASIRYYNYEAPDTTGRKRRTGKKQGKIIHI